MLENEMRITNSHSFLSHFALSVTESLMECNIPHGWEKILIRRQG